MSPAPRPETTDDPQQAHSRIRPGIRTRTARRGPVRSRSPGPGPAQGCDRRPQRRGHQRIHPGQRPARAAVPRRLQAHRHRQRGLRGRLGAGELRRNRHGPPARTPGVQGHADPRRHPRRLQEARHQLQRHHLAGSHQLFRLVPGQRRDPGLAAGAGSGPHGQFAHRQERPGQRDDRGPQRNGARRERARQRVPAAPARGLLPLAQLRQLHHRQPLGRGKRADRPPAGLLPHLVPARQRHRDRGRALRHRARAQVDPGQLRQAQAPQPHPAAALHGRTDPGRRARDQRAPGR